MQYFTSAFDLYSLFFAINTGMTDMKEFQVQTKAKADFVAKGMGILHEEPREEGTSMLKKFSLIVKKVVDCCKE